MSKIAVDQLADEINKIMDEFQDVTVEACEKGVTETAKEAVEELRNAHPAGSGKYSSWNEYNKGWKYTTTKTDKRYGKKATVHNVSKYRLTHLLEKGHAKVDGGRTKAFPHIAPVAERCEGELLMNIKKYI